VERFALGGNELRDSASLPLLLTVSSARSSAGGALDVGLIAARPCSWVGDAYDAFSADVTSGGSHAILLFSTCHP
jgi:hypothetical protein